MLAILARSLLAVAAAAGPKTAPVPNPVKPAVPTTDLSAPPIPIGTAIQNLPLKTREELSALTGIASSRLVTVGRTSPRSIGPVSLRLECPDVVGGGWAWFLRTEHLPPDDPRIAPSIDGLAQAAMVLGRAEETVTLQRRAVALLTRSLGEHHPFVANTRSNLAATLGQLGRYDEALPELREALTVQERAYGEHHMQVAITLAILAPILAKSERLDEALAMGARATAICEHEAETNAADCAFVYSNVGTVLDWAGRTSESSVAQQRAVQLLESTASPDLGVLAVTLTNLASTRAALGDDASAQADLVRVIALYERELGADAAPLWHPLLRLARLHRERGRATEALPVIQRASAITQANPVAPLRMADLEYEHLLVRWAAGLRDAETRAVAERAREHAARAESADDVALIDRWLAEHPLPGQHP